MDRKLEKPISKVRRELRRVEHLSCPVYQSPLLAQSEHNQAGLSAGIYARRDIEYARALVSAPSTEMEEYAWSPVGLCHIPKVQLYVCIMSHLYPASS